MNRPERIEEDDVRQDGPLEQRDRDLRPSLLQERRGPLEVTPVATDTKAAEANPEPLPRSEEKSLAPGDARETPQSVWNDETELREYRSRWSTIQIGFVDEPKQAVREADQLVQSVVKTLADRFTKQREELYQQWDRGDNVSTEDLRIAVQHYRTFFDRLLNL